MLAPRARPRAARAARRTRSRRGRRARRPHAGAGPRRARRGGVDRRADLAHLLGDDLDVVWIPALAPVSPGDVPYVVTVHDRSFEERPGDFTAYERLWHAAARPRRLARRAARVVTDTAAVRGRAARGVGARARERRRARACVRSRPSLRAPGRVRAVRRRARAAQGSRGAGPGGGARPGSPRGSPGTGRLADDVQAAGGRLLGRVSDAELDALLAGRARARAAVPPRGLRLPAARGRAVRHAEHRERPPGAARDAGRRRRALRATRAIRPRSPTPSGGCATTRRCGATLAAPRGARAGARTWERRGARAARRPGGGGAA